MAVDSAKLFQNFLRDLVTDFVALVSGIASAILGAIGASRKTPLPNWTFWVAAAICLPMAGWRSCAVRRFECRLIPCAELGGRSRQARGRDGIRFLA